MLFEARVPSFLKDIPVSGRHTEPVPSVYNAHRLGEQFAKHFNKPQIAKPIEGFLAEITAGDTVLLAARKGEGTLSIRPFIREATLPDDEVKRELALYLQLKRILHPERVQTDISYIRCFPRDGEVIPEILRRLQKEITLGNISIGPITYGNRKSYISLWTIAKRE